MKKESAGKSTIKQKAERAVKRAVKRAMNFFVGRLDMRIFCRNIRRGDVLFDIPLCFWAFPW